MGNEQTNQQHQEWWLELGANKEWQLDGLSAQDKKLITDTVYTSKKTREDVKLSNGQTVHIYLAHNEKDYVPPKVVDGQIPGWEKGSAMDWLATKADEFKRWFEERSPILDMPDDIKLPPGWTAEDKQKYNEGQYGTNPAHVAPDWRISNDKSDLNQGLKVLKTIGIVVLVVGGVLVIGGVAWGGVQVKQLFTK